jgi:hypothetical protein
MLLKELISQGWHTEPQLLPSVLTILRIVWA